MEHIFYIYFLRVVDKGEDGGVKHEQQKEQQEESKCVGGKERGERGRRRGGRAGREGGSGEVNGGKYREQRERNDGLNPD